MGGGVINTSNSLVPHSSHRSASQHPPQRLRNPSPPASHALQPSPRMPRGHPNPKPPVAPLPKREGKVRRFFSKVIPLPPFLQVAAAPSSPRPVTSERVLAALQPDAEVVDAAKTFVKEKMGDDKYEVVTARAPVTRTAAATGTGIRKAILTGKPTAGTPGTGKLPGRRGRPPGKLHKASSAKTVVKRVAIGTGLRGTVASRLKANARAREKEEPVTRSRKSTLRSHTAPHATESTPAPPSTVASSAASVPTSGSPTAAKVTPPPSIRFSLSLNPGPRAEGITVGSQEVREANPAKRKEYMTAGLYCQDEHPPEEAQLVERILQYKGIRKPGRPRKSIQFLPPIPTPEGMHPSFPPFPLDHGYRMFFDKEVEFRLPFNIMWERDSGALDGKKRPPSFGKLRTNQFVERSKRMAERAVCKCDPSSDCGDNCMNRHMNYLCGKDCPTGERCTNKSLTRRPQKAYRIVWTGPRGFGMLASENIAEGEFVMDYRGEVIDIEEFCHRIDSEYKGTRNFYALHYDGCEVVDAGMRGNDARFINHGCSPNLEVRKLETLGDGFEEYEIGFWATRDIKAGDELLYDYNFEAFSVGELANNEVRTYLAEARPGTTSEGAIHASSASSHGWAKFWPRCSEHPIKRKPGRPRIHPLPDPNAPKRKPGRPRIHPLPDPNAPKPPTQAIATDVSVKQEVDDSEQESEVGPIRVGTSNQRSAPYDKSAPVEMKKRGPGRPRKYPIPSPPPGLKRGPGRPRKVRNPEDELPLLGPRITPKQAEKAKRNGAPAGWAFVPVMPAGEVPQAPPRRPTPPPSNRALRAARLASAFDKALLRPHNVLYLSSSNSLHSEIVQADDQPDDELDDNLSLHTTEDAVDDFLDAFGDDSPHTPRQAGDILHEHNLTTAGLPSPNPTPRVGSARTGLESREPTSTSTLNHSNSTLDASAERSLEADVGPSSFKGINKSLNGSMSGSVGHPVAYGRRESLTSTVSGGSNGSAQVRAARMAARKNMGQHLSLGVDAEIKAEEAAAMPKRRSIFRTSGTASTPDLSTLIRGKRSHVKQQQNITRQVSGSSAKYASVHTTSTSSSAIASQLSSAHTGSTSSLGQTGSIRQGNQSLQQPQRGNTQEWDRQSSHSNMTAHHYADRERAMPSISEGQPGAEPLGRHTSVDEGSKIKRAKGKGMFGRMFGSSSSTKEHHGPLTSGSQLSLSGRSQVDVGSPQSSSSPQLASSPRFPGNAQFNFERPPSNGSVDRPPIPPRPAVPIVPKAAHPDGDVHTSEAANLAARVSADTNRPVLVTRVSQQSAVLEQRETEATGPAGSAKVELAAPSPTRSPSISSTASVHDQPLAQVQVLRPPEAPVYEPAPVPSRASSRKVTADGNSPRAPGRAASSFSDDVTGLLDRIGHTEAAALGMAMTHEPESSEHLQVSPDRSGSIGTAAGARYRAYAVERSPSLGHVPRSPVGMDDSQVPEPLPVPSIDGSAPPSAHIPSPSVVAEAMEPEVVRDDSSETESHTVPTPSPGLRVPSPRSSVAGPEVPPKRPDRQSTWEKQNAANTSNTRLDTESLIVEGASSAGQSSTNLNDIADIADEDKGRQLAMEFLSGDAAHVPPDKVAMFLGGPRAVNKAALRYYMQHFDMRGFKLDLAFRDLCAKLHLKAESQEIDRIIEGFSARFYDCNPNTVYGTPGVVHTVTGAMLMLNTDLHIADIPKHMSRADFVRNSMRAIQESMPDRESTPDLVNDSGSLRNMDSLSASQSATSVRLRNTVGTPRNASGNLISPASELTSTSTQDLRSRGASTTTVNSFTYTKAWEMEAENALKEIYSNVRNERILLPIAAIGDPNNSSASTLGGLRVGTRGGINALMRPNSKNAPYNAMFNSQGDGSLSPTPSYANSIGDLALQPTNPIGFAGNLSHTVIREQEDEVHSIRSGETSSTIEELNDDELALLGAPWAKEGLLQRKIQVEAHGRKPQKKDWKQYFVVIQKGDLSMFVFGSGGGSSMGSGTVGGGNWMSSANRHGEYSLMHAMAMALPKPGYSASRPHCFTVTFPNGEISVFQAGTEELVLEWVATCNYWAARKSRQPLVGGVSNMEYGWTRVLNQLDDNGQHQEQHPREQREHKMGLGARARLGAISRVRGASSSGNDRVQLDKIHINDWKPPPHATMPSTLDEEAQLESLSAYVQSLKEELDQHKTIEEPMSRLYTSGSKNAMRARENWTTKSRYTHSEIFKYETYVEALRNAINHRVQRQGERKVERSLARSAPSIRREAPSRKLTAGGGPSQAGMVPTAHVSHEPDDAYLRRSVDQARQTPTTQAQAM
ncbi:hypothetical protein CspeluHIS016_0405490 [Cutaneotrichosporon spelunceum]|uniref:SEC7 domain-containing protein n=1 Tax=Cutaneotrichosporon spelunceum TaxID=1672016 RepID=A0AAD3TWE6_9TREE|nr:hypothetical protein CspeluHIS016_0405490 [Cutaneotrichosporon spelunceum]